MHRFKQLQRQHALLAKGKQRPWKANWHPPRLGQPKAVRGRRWQTLSRSKLANKQERGRRYPQKICARRFARQKISIVHSNRQEWKLRAHRGATHTADPFQVCCYDYGTWGLVFDDQFLCVDIFKWYLYQILWKIYLQSFTG